MSTPASAATWTLEVPDTHPEPESKTMPDPNHGEESVIGDDYRELVFPVDFQDGGKYRSIVKIQARFISPETGDDLWMMGSGWLIRPDLLVTAGHVVFDKARGCGAATQLKCYIGYNGMASVPKPGTAAEAAAAVQPRYGAKVVTTESWIKESDSRIRDVAFIQVHKPFTGKLNVFDFIETVTPATLRLGVVGYPGDQKLGKEIGAQMYELFDTTRYDLEKHKRHMISYIISTYGGQSGAPILSKQADGSLVAIGTHCYGAGSGETTNSGNPIGGKYGNDYNYFISLFTPQNGVSYGKPNEITYVPSNGVVRPPTFSQTGFSPVPSTAPAITTHPAPHVEEGFFDTLRSIARVGASVLPAGGALLGPIGSVVGTAAGGLLGALAGQESIVAAPGQEVAPGAAERAVLAEASLQAVLSMVEHNDTDDPTVSTILSHMSQNYTANAPNVDALATRLAPQLTECALDVAAHRLGRAMTAPRGEESVVEQPRRALTGVAGGAESGMASDAFTEGLLSATVPVAGAEEGAFDFLGPLISKAVSFAKPLVSQAAKAAVTTYLPKVIDHFTGSGAESVVAVQDKHVEASKILFQRALVADTALTALMALPREQLNALKVRRSSQESMDGLPQEEGIFDFIKTVAQKIGPFALSAAKGAVKRFAPVIIDAAAGKLKGYLGPNGAAESPAAGQRTIKRQPSALERYRAGLQTQTPTVSVRA